MKTVATTIGAKRRLLARLLFVTALLTPVLLVFWREAPFHSAERRHPGLPLDAGGMIILATPLLAAAAIASAVSFVLYARSLVDEGRVTMWRCLELALLPLPALPFLLLMLLLFSAGTPPMASHP